MYIDQVIECSFNIEGVGQRQEHLLIFFALFGCLDGPNPFLIFVHGKSKLSHTLTECIQLCFEALLELIELLRRKLIKINFLLTHYDIYLNIFKIIQIFKQQFQDHIYTAGRNMLRKFQQNLFYNFSQFIKLSNMEGKYQNIAKLELDNPKKKNALSISLLDQLDVAIKEINKQHTLRAVVLKSSQQGYFCSGADLKQRADKTSQEIQYIVFNLRRIFNDLRNIHCPVLCLIDGPALGGGLQLALNADIRIATQKSLIGLPQTYWSLIPGAGGTQTLSRVIGVPKAKQLIFTARKLNGKEAFDYGIVNYCEESFNKVQQKAMGLIDEMLQNAPLGIKHAKRAINWGNQVDMRSGLQIQRFNYERIVHTEDRKEGIKAFTEKRKPVYKGK